MINALMFTDELEKAGFSKEQAKKSVETWMSLINDNFATKSDLRELQLMTKADLKEVKTDLEGQIKELKTDLEGQIKDLKIDLEGQIKELKTDLEKQISVVNVNMQNIKTEIIFDLGRLMIGLMAISTGIISIVIAILLRS